MKLNSDIVTQKLVLKSTSISDARFLLQLVNTPKWLKYITNKIRPQIESLGYGNYTVIRQSDDIKI